MGKIKGFVKRTLSFAPHFIVLFILVTGVPVIAGLVGRMVAGVRSRTGGAAEA